MAGYGYSYPGYSTYNTPQTEDWSKTTYASDHVCRPVIIDATGRKRPIVSYTPTENMETYVTKAENLSQQHVHSPVPSEYKYGGRPASDLVEDYAVDAYGAGKKWNQPNDRPEKVEEFLNKVQTEVSRPRFGPLNASYWRTPAYAGYQGNTGGYGEFNDQSNREWQTPNSNSYRNEKYDNYYQKNGSPIDTATFTSGEWTRPSQTTWTAPSDASLSRPTNDVNTAMRLLQQVARTSAPPAPKSRYGEPSYAEIIDSKEAARKYGNFNYAPTPRSYAAEDNYSTSIDSREAARKYRGTTV